MSALLVIAGAVVLFGFGWLVGRERSDRSVRTGGIRVAPVAAADPDGTLVVVVRRLLDEHPTGVVVADADGVIGLRNAAARAMSGTHVGVLLDEAIERHLDVRRLGHPSDEMLEMYGPPKSVFVVAARPLPTVARWRSSRTSPSVAVSSRCEPTSSPNISHELKTPVGAMSVLAETLEAETDPETIHRMVIRIMSEAHVPRGRSTT